MSRPEKIRAILARRAAHAGSLAEVDSRLAAMTGALADLDGARLDLLDRGIDEEARQRLFEIGRAIHELDVSVGLQRAEVDTLTRRLSRPTLNIGMVGRARTGKSTFLQSLTGLTTREIPAGDSGFCTGVPSLIQHAPGPDTIVRIHLHDERSFLADIIGPYYQELGLGGPPSSARDFAARPLSALPAKDAPDAKAESRYGHLTLYHRNYAEYGSLLSTESPLTVGPDEIRKYVAQLALDGTTEYHTFRAVRQVDILTEYPRTDATGLGVIDLPGLGDTNLGDSRILLSALHDDVDVVLFVRKPEATGDDIQDFDYDLYTIAQEALPEIPMHLRSFLIINHDRTPGRENLANARRYKGKIEASSIQVVESRIADCSDPGEVATAFDAITDYLLAHVDELDGHLLAASVRATAEINEKVEALLRQASLLAVEALPHNVVFREFQRLFNRAYQQLTGSVERLVKRKENDRDSPDNGFAAEVAAVLKQARSDDAIPSVEEIADRIDLKGSNQIASGELLTELRPRLSRHFLKLDRALKTQVAAMQEEVAGLLGDKGELHPLSYKEGREFLVELAEWVQPTREDNGDEETGENEIWFALMMLADFELAYRGLIQHRIRPCLDGMHPDHPTIPVGAEDWDALTPQAIRDILEQTYTDAVRKCELALQGILAEPNSALFAIVEEFKDRVLRAEATRDMWEAFYWDVRGEVWAGPLGALTERSGQFRTWNQRVSELRACLPQPARPSPGSSGHPDDADRTEGV
jgi:hypothetical protein